MYEGVAHNIRFYPSSDILITFFAFSVRLVDGYRDRRHLCVVIFAFSQICSISVTDLSYLFTKVCSRKLSNRRLIS